MAKKRPKQEEPAKLTGSQDLTARQLRAVIDRYQAPGGQRRWNPNGTTFEEGQVLLKKALHCVGLDPDATLFTSRDPVAQELKKILKTSNVPEGFEKWQLPFSLYEPSNVFLPGGAVCQSPHALACARRRIPGDPARVHNPGRRHGIDHRRLDVCAESAPVLF
jgi:hypothetical protein